MVSKEDLQKRYDAFTDEALIDILTREKDSYSILAQEVAQEELVRRGMNPEHITQSYAENGQDEQEDYQANVFHNISHLITEVQDIEEEVSANYEEVYQKMSPAELLSTYTRMINKIAEKQAFGDTNMEDSLANLIVLNKAIRERETALPEDLLESRRKVLALGYKIKYREENIKRWIKIAVGLALVIFILLGLEAGVFRLVFLLILFFAFRLIYTGIRQTRHLKTLFE